jgi:hypothetical protein
MSVYSSARNSTSFPVIRPRKRNKRQSMKRYQYEVCSFWHPERFLLQVKLDENKIIHPSHSTLIVLSTLNNLTLPRGGNTMNQ